MTTPISWLTGPAQPAVRGIARDRLHRVQREAARLARPLGLAGAAPDEPEAIHDFRVALRRLRIWLWAFRDYLPDSLHRNTEPRLRRWSGMTGAARDLEVQLAWLSGPAPSGPSLASARQLAETVRSELGEAKAILVKALATGFPETARALAEALELPGAATRRIAPEPMNAAMARALGRSFRALKRSLRSVRRVGDARQAHRARIAVKRLRYLLEALGPLTPSLRPGIDQLIRLQHLLGELHDAQLLHARIPQGFKALRGQLRGRIVSTFRKVCRAIHAASTASAFDGIAELLDRLERAARVERAARPFRGRSGLSSGRVSLPRIRKAGSHGTQLAGLRAP
jgi:CHAD domain-containing protein